MSRVVFLLEEYSAKVLLDEFLPVALPTLQFLCVPHEGKQDLEKSIPRKLRAWREPGVRFVVVRDNDGADCVAVKRRLVALCRQGERTDTVVRIACQELEAWYFGQPSALAQIFGDPTLEELSRKARYRDPDAIVQPSAELERIVPAFQKVSGARRLGPLLAADQNTSRSFAALVASLRALSAGGVSQ